MDTAIWLFRSFVITLIDAIELLMFVRAILSWFDQTEEWRISSFLYLLTEPIILPVRRLCEKMHWFEGVPLDFPFLLTWILLSVIQVLVSLL